MPKGFLLHRPSSLTMSAPNPKKRLLHCALIEFAEMVSHKMPLPPSPVSPDYHEDIPVNLTTSASPSPPVRATPEPPLTPDYFQDLPVLSTKFTAGSQSPPASTAHAVVTAPADARQTNSPQTSISKASIPPIGSVGAVVTEVSTHEDTAPARHKRLCTSKFTCKLCRLNFSDPLSLARHVCAAIRPVEYKCPECDKVFNNPANLASHRRWHKPSASQQLQCPHCTQLFRRNTLLKKHIDAEHPTHRQGQQQHIQQSSHPQTVILDESRESQEEQSFGQCSPQSTTQSLLSLTRSSHDPNSLRIPDQGGHFAPLHSHTNFVIHGLIHHPESPFMPPLPGIH